MDSEWAKYRYTINFNPLGKNAYFMASGKKFRDKGKAEARTTFNLRREYIVRQLRSRGVLSYARYNNEWNSPNSTTLKEDINALNQVGYDLETIEYGGRRYILDRSGKHLFAKALRAKLSSRSKEAISMVAASLVLGIPEKFSAKSKDGFSRALLAEKNPEILPCWTQSEIRHHLENPDQGNAHSHAGTVLRTLRRIWDEENSTVFLDSGTTIDKIAKWFQNLLVPTCYSNLRSLNVCTNSPAIFEALSPPEIPVRTIIVGGNQVVTSQALAGIFAEAFFEATKSFLQFSIGFVGSTNIDLRSERILSDSAEEKEIKSLVLARSALKVICVDSTKITPDSIRHGFCFARLDPKSVDLVIINQDPEPRGDIAEGGDQAGHIANVVGAIRARGVPVIQAAFLPDYVSTKEVATGEEFRCRLPLSSAESLLINLNIPNDAPRNKPIEALLNAVVDEFNAAIEGNDRKKEAWIGRILERIQKAV